MAQLDQIAPALVGNAESEDGVVDIQRAGAIDLGCLVGEETSFDRALRRYISRSHLERSRRGLLRASRIHPLKSLIQFCRVGAFDPLLHGSVPFFDVYIWLDVQIQVCDTVAQHPLAKQTTTDEA